MSKLKYPATLLGLMIGLMVGGCSTKVEVSSDTCWTGYVNNASVEGCRSNTWSVREPGSCFTFQKTTAEGTLRARVKGWKGDNRWVETSTAFGVVTVCAQQ